jgi:hypothetical protein
MWAGGPGSSAGKEADGGQSYYCMDGKDDIAAGFQDIAAAKKLQNPVTALNSCSEYDTYDGANIGPEPAYNNGHWENVADSNAHMSYFANFSCQFCAIFR